jgi:hypothetical protein
VQHTTRNAPASGKKEAPDTDKAITFREVNDLTGSACKTSHTARALAARGQIRAIRINERVVRYSLNSVLALISGRVDAVASPLRPTAGSEVRG